MPNLNKVMLIGHLGRDAELRHTSNGNPVANWSMAVTEKWKDSNGAKQERTEWARCTMFGKRAEGLAQYLTKGTAVYVEGKMQTRKWTDKEQNERETTEVNVWNVELLGNRQNGGGQNQNRLDPADGPTQPALSEDDIPF